MCCAASLALLGAGACLCGDIDFERAGGAALCGLLPIVPDQIVSPAAATALLGIVRQSAEAGLPQLRLRADEPPLKPYAQQDGG